MQTGENEQALRKILDMTRLFSIVILLFHFYYFGYSAFQEWQFSSHLTDRLLSNMYNTGLFSGFHYSKWLALGLLFISLLGAKGRKEEKVRFSTASAYILAGLIIYFGSGLMFWSKMEITQVVGWYMGLTGIGYLSVLSGGSQLSRIIKFQLLNKDIFNQENETFPQEERRLENEYSINLPARYRLKNKVRKSWINIVNPFRALLVLGSPGAGKSYFVIRHVITQHIRKDFTMFVYDFKFDDLSRIVYNTWLNNKDTYPVPPQFFVINFDDLTRSHRCNPLDQASMLDITDAAESARTILMGLNREWIKRQGDFLWNHPLTFLRLLSGFYTGIRTGNSVSYRM